ncbi:MAG: GPW/gp25 family protein [Flavobacteriales bacterium]|nr:GPW/gp25 family protein [Flavobacteriales bacterium]
MEVVTGYRIPLDFDNFFGTRTFVQCSVIESISFYVHVLLLTTHGEFEFDQDFGCEVWETEFEHQQTTRLWVEQLGRNIQEVLEKYETRLTNIHVQAKVSQMEFENKEEFKVSKRLKKKLNLVVNAKLRATNEKFELTENILLSPFATD